MALDVDQEILGDFLVEAGEILELLSEQLVDLERHPEDRELLNAIFRGFHTVKGGAGFLQLEPMVECCHSAENLFDQLRNQALQVTSELMDVVLQSLDAINGMFEAVRGGEYPENAAPQLIARLNELASGVAISTSSAAHRPAIASDPVSAPVSIPASGAIASASAQVDVKVPADLNAEFEMLLADLDEGQAAVADSAPAEPDLITEDEFENLLDELHGAGAPGISPDIPPGVAASVGGTRVSNAPASDLITEDEFENLLDELHGDGAPGITTTAAVAALVPSSDAPGSDLITEDEFENLLDELHGDGAPGIDVAAKRRASVEPRSQADVELDALLDQSGVMQSVLHSGQGDVALPQAAVAADLITEDEFECLLDNLQQKGEGAFMAQQVVTDSPVSGAAVHSATAALDSTASVSPTSRGENEAKKAAAETNVRVDTRLLDQMMNMVGELVLVRNRLVRLGADKEEGELSKALGSLDMVTADLQMSVMKTRMQPVKKVFGRFPRLVRDLSRQLHKEVKLELRGEDTDLDKNLVEALADPLIHLVRNAIDHGIELPELRQQRGKSREGHVLLSAEQEGDHILLVIEDDGAGMDPEKLRRLAVERGMLDSEAAARLSEHECFNLIFAAGFSTKSEVSDVSGRGVGMDVVKTKISQLNGKLEINSTLGAGSRIEIQVPLTLAIMPTLMVLLEGQAFALPLVNVNEIFSLDLTQINVVDGQQVIIVRDKAISLFHLKRWLVAGHQSDSLPDKGHVVIANVGTIQVAFVVDQLVGQEEVVIKPLGSVLQGTPGLSGATITGDGRIALILDIPNLLKCYAS